MHDYRSFGRVAAAASLVLAAPAWADPDSAAPTDVAADAGAEPDPEQTIVVIGTRGGGDRTLSSDRVTDRMSQSSRSIERDVLTAAGTYRLSDALDLISGISNQNNRGGFLDNFAIRGFLGTPDGGAEYYVDGFLANRGMAPPRDPATAERIEVLKGPGGALFGDVDPGGRVNIVSKTPRFDAATTASVTYGSFDTRRAELDLTGPISSTLAVRLVVAAEESNGWRDFVTLSRRVVAPSLTWRPSPDLRLTYVGEITRFDAPFDRGIPAIGGDANALPRRQFYGEPADGVTEFRNQRHQLTALAGLGNGWSVNAGLAYRTGTLAGFSSDHTSLRADDRTLWRQRRVRDYSVSDLSARVELSGAIGSHSLTAGLKGYYLDYHDKYLRRSPNAGAPYAIDVYDPVHGGPMPTPIPFVDNLEKRWVATAYVQDMWEVTDRLTLLGGLRIDAYRQRLTNSLTGRTGRAVDQPIDGRLGARYRFGDRIALHVNWGESFLLNSGTGRTGEGFAPERGRGYEIGTTAAWHGIDLAATWFDITKRGILTGDPIDPAYNAPVGELISHGIELDASVRIAERWQIVANYAWTRARTADRTFATSRVLNVPEHSATLFAFGRFTDGDGRGPTIGAGVSYVGDRSGTLDASGLMLPGYLKARASIDYALSRRVGVRLEADNLFDARYAQSSYSTVWIYPGAPRTVRATLRLNY